MSRPSWPATFDEAGEPRGSARRRDDPDGDGADRDADHLRHAGIGADKAHVETRTAQLHEPGGEGYRHNCDRKARIDTGAKLRQFFERPQWRRLRKRGLGILPGAVEKVEQKVHRDIVEEQRRDDLVDSEAQLQKYRDQNPDEPAGRGRETHEVNARPLRSEGVDRDAGRGDAAENHLALEAEIPEADPEGETGGETDKDKRRRLNQNRSQIVGVERAGEFVGELAGRNPGDIEHHERNREPDPERSRDEA